MKHQFSTWAEIRQDAAKSTVQTRSLVDAFVLWRNFQFDEADMKHVFQASKQASFGNLLLRLEKDLAEQKPVTDENAFFPATAGGQDLTLFEDLDDLKNLALCVKKPGEGAEKEPEEQVGPFSAMVSVGQRHRCRPAHADRSAQP